MKENEKCLPRVSEFMCCFLILLVLMGKLYTQHRTCKETKSANTQNDPELQKPSVFLVEFAFNQ